MELEAHERADLLAATASGEPATGLRAVTALRALADRLETLHVASAREAGWTWTEIAQALGVSKQAAHKKHAEPRRRRGRS
ncbi:MAG: RNA polymerase subunit sigma-70 [Egibacteraceae bacterium]